MGKINIVFGKTLRLNNVLQISIYLNQKDINIDKMVEQMENYILTKGNVPVGPLIQYSYQEIDSEGNVEIKLVLMRQCKNYIHNVENMYKMNSVVKIENCLYCRFIGIEENLKYAYSKMGVCAYEADKTLSGETYTIYVDELMDETSVIDVFMPVQD